MGFLLYLVFGIILFMIMEKIKEKDLELYLVTLFPLIYISLFSSLFNEYKNFSFIIVLIYIIIYAFKYFSTADILKTKTVKEERISIFFEVILSFLFSLVYIRNVVTIFPSANEFRSLFLIIVIIFFLRLLKHFKLDELKLFNLKINKKSYEELILTSFIKKKFKLNYKFKTKEEETLYISLLLELDRKTPYFERIKNEFLKEEDEILYKEFKRKTKTVKRFTENQVKEIILQMGFDLENILKIYKTILKNL